MEKDSVLLLDDDIDVRESVGDLVTILCGRDCVAVGSFDELTAARERALACRVAVVDINLGAGKPTGLDAYEWLRAERFAGRIIFLTGHAANHPLVQRAAAFDGGRVLAKPVGLSDLRDAITLAAA